MPIHWYPGHMHKAQKEMREVLPKIDIIIEVLDARIPYSSENPAIAEIRGNTPCIKVLSKSDLADPEGIAQWQAFYERDRHVKTLAITTEKPSIAKQIPDLCRKLLDLPDDDVKTRIAMIVGIPNVGKSTLINTLTGRTIAKVGNEPAVTKTQQRINLGNGILLLDTPGILWPKIDNPGSTMRLAITGAIKDTAMEYEEAALFACETLMKLYPERVKERYQIKDLPETDFELLELIGARRGCKGRGGRVDLFKASESLLHDIRASKLGNICLELPDLVEAEEQKVAEEKARKEAEQEAKRQAKIPQRQREQNQRKD